MKLTIRTIESLVPSSKRQYYYDDDLPGFGLAVTPAGAKSFFVQYRKRGAGRSGTSKRLTLGRFPQVTAEQARKKAEETLAKVVMGEDPVAARAADKAAPMVADVLAEFMTEHVKAKRKPTTARLYESLARLYILPGLGKLKVEEVTSKQVARLHHDLKGKPYMANRFLSMVSKLFNWCERRGCRKRNTNPAYDIDRYPEHKRTRFLANEELGKFGSSLTTLEATGKLDPVVAAALRLLLFTGSRLNEVLTLRWSDLDLEAGLAHLQDSKTGAKTVHLGAPALALLETLPRINEWCFPSQRTDKHIVNLRKTFVAVCKDAGLIGWRPHDLRHAFGAMAANSGHSLPVIGAMLGHVQPSTTARYAHVAANPVHQAADATATKIDQALNSGKVAALPKRKSG